VAAPVTAGAPPVTTLRAGATVLGAYAYVVALLVAGEPVTTIREWLNRQLGLGEDFGPFAIMLLLVCTGYTAAATGFEARRLAWVCVPALVAVALALAAGTVPLIWVTVLQVGGWLVALDRRTWPTTLALLAAIGVLCLFSTDLTWLGRPLAFLPLVLVGHVAWRVLAGTLPVRAGVLLGAGCVGAVIGVDDAFPGLDQWWYPVAATFTVLVFVVAARPGATTAAVDAHPVTRGLAAVAEWPILVGPVLVAVVGV
jgi:hypothetical protein